MALAFRGSFVNRGVSTSSKSTGFSSSRQTPTMINKEAFFGKTLARRFSEFTHIDHTKLSVTKTTAPKKKSPYHTLTFGTEFSDHMLEVDWTKQSGWEAPRITPYHKLELDPSCSVFHYASELFEGMKAYKDKQNNIRLFRPDKNVERMNRSAQRIVLPTYDQHGFMECLKTLLRIDKDWIPDQKGYSLYIRPTLIGTAPAVGVTPSSKAKLFVILSPVGPYYPEGWKPVKLWAEEKFVRAWPGGTGDAKVGANYAIGIVAQVESAKRGYSQVLWVLNDYVTEVGAMNMMVFIQHKNGEKELLTPPLDGTILPGVTRDTMLSLARSWNEFKVSERPITMTELAELQKEGRVLELFGCGTAAVVSPVSTIHYKGQDLQFPVDKVAGIGPLAKRFVDTITGIQYGEIPHEWSVVV